MQCNKNNCSRGTRKPLEKLLTQRNEHEVQRMNYNPHDGYYYQVDSFLWSQREFSWSGSRPSPLYCWPASWVTRQAQTQQITRRKCWLSDLDQRVETIGMHRKQFFFEMLDNLLLYSYKQKFPPMRQPPAHRMMDTWIKLSKKIKENRLKSVTSWMCNACMTAATIFMYSWSMTFYPIEIDSLLPWQRYT